VASHGRQSVVEARLLNGTILIYGATGYTGRLIAKAASDKGARPILAGRNLDKVRRVAEPLGLSARAFDLRDPARPTAARMPAAPRMTPNTNMVIGAPVAHAASGGG
jgi:short subunit dehydrogenase-like uncharacterized protein